ncbi:hypothetical protein G8770_13275 [Aestuariicella hydrocarbonica]|uniref:Polyhydroxybutyrate depolymerase n=1 Tax=Pseudomaricurvus hydrocarbonicus TaxID=1470433 RepID=A0A9E5JWE5_9GAMM|nr:PHB depolymerase family esterase [Aestuariicella hydrocarbonica]NHO66514.1 hypothetical protein [Aestuariicella hydrocarbonica]
MVKWVAVVLVSLVLVGAGLYGYYIHSYSRVEPPSAGVLKRDSLTVDGLERTFSYYLPNHLGARPALVFVLHGSQGRGEDIRWQTAFGFERLAETENFIAVYPNGFEHHWNDCRASASYSANTQNINDPAFFTAMVSYFSELYDIDEQRVFATGLSNGGHMAYRLAMEIPDRIRAVAPIAANLPVPENNDCRASGQPVSVAVFNGTNDPINPYDGGLVEIMGDSSRGEVLSSDDTVAYWRHLAEAPAHPTKRWQVMRGNTNEVAADVREWSSGDTSLRLYQLFNSGHVVPSAQVHYGRLFGGNMPDIEAADEIWGFFRQASE